MKRVSGKLFFIASMAASVTACGGAIEGVEDDGVDDGDRSIVEGSGGEGEDDDSSGSGATGSATGGSATGGSATGGSATGGADHSGTGASPGTGGSEPCDDEDEDGVCNADDSCPSADDASDADADGVPDGCDICAEQNDTIDADTDGVPDGCDVCADHDDGVDTDVDGVPDGCDVCADHDDGVDTDSDGVPNGCDVCEGDNEADSDADGVPDACDVCSLGDDAVDTDADSVPDACDACSGEDDLDDADADSVPDGCDVCALGDDALDADADGVADACDACPGGDDGVDTDGDGTSDFCDACEGTDDSLDIDGDQVPDACDSCGIGLTVSHAPLAFWRMADGTDLSGNGLDLTAHGALSTTTGLSEDQDLASRFDANDSYFELTGFAAPAELTVSVWFRLMPGSASEQYFTSYAVAGRDNELILGVTGGRLVTHWRSVAVSNLSADLRDGNYHHVALTYNGSNVVTYLDGAVVNTRTGVAAITSGGTLNFGQEQDSVGGGFNGAQDMDGDLDEISVFDRALSLEDIGALRASSTCSEESCAAHLSANNSATSGNYWIDPDSNGAATTPSLAYCDMTSLNGGWTLLSATGTGGVTAQRSTTVLPGVQAYMPALLATTLAGVSRQVMIRSTGAPDTEYIVSDADSLPIVNLRAGLVLNENSSMVAIDSELAYWTGPMTLDGSNMETVTYLWDSCDTSSATYPALYWSCNNAEGLHINAGNSAWDFQDNLALEVLVR